MREELPVKEAILDGEVVALDAEGRQNFRDLRTGHGNLHYAAFDALWINGKDLRGLPLTRRKRALTGLVPATTTVVSQVFSIEERGRDLFEAVGAGALAPRVPALHAVDSEGCEVGLRDRGACRGRGWP